MAGGDEDGPRTGRGRGCAAAVYGFLSSSLTLAQPRASLALKGKADHARRTRRSQKSGIWSAAAQYTARGQQKWNGMKHNGNNNDKKTESGTTKIVSMMSRPRVKQ